MLLKEKAAGVTAPSNNSRPRVFFSARILGAWELLEHGYTICSISFAM